MTLLKSILILFLASIFHKSYSQKEFKSLNHFQLNIPEGWNKLNKIKVDEIIKLREAQTGIKAKSVKTEAIIVKDSDFSYPNMQFLFNKMSLENVEFFEIIKVLTKATIKAQEIAKNDEQISDKILKSDPSKPIIDSNRKMYIYVLKQQIVGIGAMIIISANFVAKHGLITLNFSMKESEFDTYSKVFITVINSLKIDDLYLHYK